MVDAQTQTGGATDALDLGSYEVVRRRMLEQVAELSTKVESINSARKETFGGSTFELVSTGRVRTENNAVPRDMVSVGEYLLFAFHVVLGLKSQPAVSDVFALYRFERKNDGTYDLEPTPLAQTFLGSEAFAKDFADVFRYSKEARVLQLKRSESRLLIVIQIGANVRDIRVLRFSVTANGEFAYIDARGEEDYKPPASFSFQWTRAGREAHVAGAHPHVNVLDQVFLETVGGDLTIKVENNTRSGAGVYSEPVTDLNQTLDDAEFAFAKVGAIILLKVKPYREEVTRYFAFNTLSKTVRRLDAIGQSCLELPEDQGIIFPGGYYVAAAEPRELNPDARDMRFEAMVRAPNGEDVLYAFYGETDGNYVHLPYNVITKEVGTPVHCNGYSFFRDGTLAIFRAATAAEPSRVHPIQVWRTPFEAREVAIGRAKTEGYLAKIGNAELVRGISDMYSVRKLALTERPTKAIFEELVRTVSRTIDDHFWLGKPESFDPLSTLKELRKTAESVLLEFEKVETLRRDAKAAVALAEASQKEVLRVTRPEDQPSAPSFLEGLGSLRRQRGSLIGLRELRYVDLTTIEALEAEVKARFVAVSLGCIEFFRTNTAWKPLITELGQIADKVSVAGKVVELATHHTSIEALSSNLTLLGETVSTLEVEDATIRTEVLEHLSTTMAVLNRTRAVFDQRRKELFGKEGRAELSVQLGVFSQAVGTAAVACTTPEACDAELGKLFMRLEELTARFGELDDFATLLADKRDEVEGAFGSRRQSLVDERQKRSTALWTSAERMLEGIARKAASMAGEVDLLAYFAADPTVQRTGELVGQLAALGENVRAEELASRLKSSRQDAIRKLRDKKDLLDGDTVRLGKHRFSVTTRALDLVLVERDDGLALHLTGTDFYEATVDERLTKLRDVWQLTLPSESPDVYRSELLAFDLLTEMASNSTLLARIRNAIQTSTLRTVVGDAAAARLDEGYERGVHDADAAQILHALIAVNDQVGLLRYAPNARATCMLYWKSLAADHRIVLEARARSLARARDFLEQSDAMAEFCIDLSHQVSGYAADTGIVLAAGEASDLGPYLSEVLSRVSVKFVVAAASADAARALRLKLETQSHYREFARELELLVLRPAEQLQVALAYATAFAGTDQTQSIALELAAIVLTDGVLEHAASSADAHCTVTGLLGNHPRLQDGALGFSLPEFLVRLRAFRSTTSKRFREFRQIRSELLEHERQRLRLSEFTPRVLSSFVRNRLIDEVYLALVGNNFAKQLGAAGDQKRTDRMGLLLLVSPPGYGKTTLMEYVASTLGLVFVKVNGPALGHDVTSLDPESCTSLTARQEVERINLAFEMGNNVMLYLDDVQHTSAEFLEKFISLCDAQRKVEGVYKGRSRTYDFRGKRFCVVMAANPYTESGARFKIPDMLANRADTHNLGEVLDGKADLFALSYVENALTSHPTLAPIAGRDPKDVHVLVRMAAGETLPNSALVHGYGGAELAEILSLLRLVVQAQTTLLKVNATYIAAASQEDAYRTEPPFKLQGSYRNMNKIVQKLASVMTAEELERTVDEHYQSESQTLTTGAEQNLLKLAELRNRISESQIARWSQIKDGFRRANRQGKGGDDPVARLTATLAGLEEQLQAIREAIGAATAQAASNVSEQVHAQAAFSASQSSANGAAIERSAAQALAGSTQVAGVLADVLQEVRRLAAPNIRVSMSSPSQQQLQLNIFESFARSIVHELAQLRPTGSAPSPDLTDKLAALEQALGRVTAPQLEITADLRAGDSTNLYSDSLGALRGIFVGTYSKPPPLRTSLKLQMVLPGDASHHIVGVVAFVQDEDGDRPAGYGIAFTQLAAHIQAELLAYARRRAPALYDLDGH